MNIDVNNSITIFIIMKLLKIFKVNDEKEIKNNRSKLLS